MVRLFRRAREILAAGDQDFWEEEGGFRREFLDAWSDLHGLLGRQPWEINPLDVDRYEPPPESDEDWRTACELRRRLDEASCVQWEQFANH